MAALLQFMGLIIGTSLLLLMLIYMPGLFVLGFFVAFFGLIADLIIEKLKHAKKD